MRVALDTNILAYAEGIGEKQKQTRAIRLVEQLPVDVILIPAQTLAELYRVLTVKAERNRQESRSAILGWADSFDVADSTWASFQTAFDLSVDHQFSIWDALILSVASENHCRILLSEDMQNGFTWSGVTIVNPFVIPPDPLLESLLKEDK
ncbi:MAG: VapC toxin family PIN domain ribonuclease [Spirochaetes bacterium]|nr:MAG: VapC toxin family PIN domain ribonuclease [Spirochaetota bacterium]